VVVEQKQQLGLNENSGFDGRLHTSVHDIEARINQARPVSRSSGPRPIDSLRPSIANLNFRRWRRVRLSNLGSQYGSGNLGKKYVQAQFN
jgi:hypothetical protein